jgi:glycosyltransferase involved in cell wall biosynthesis
MTEGDRTVPDTPQRVLVVGVHQATDAYPNTRYRLEHLQRRFDATHVNEPLWTGAGGGVASARAPVCTLARALGAHARIWWRLATAPRADVAYVPYPAVGVALVLGLLPRRRRPSRIVLDGFISVYDTIVNDRRLWQPRALLARLLWRLERLAFRRADVVVVDTPQNARFYADLFALPPARFVPVPLATNETAYRPMPIPPAQGPARVLFIGTLVPLQGIETIGHAIRLLSHRPDVQFTILGDGQDAPRLEASLGGMANVTWVRRWHSAEELAGAIAASDLCLGIFGGTDKAQRVCPYKLYAYAAVGRAAITGDTAWLRSVVASGIDPPFHPVAVDDPAALAGAIAFLLDHPAERDRLAANARRFYETSLANARSMPQLERLLVQADAAGEG